MMQTVIYGAAALLFLSYAWFRLAEMWRSDVDRLWQRLGAQQSWVTPRSLAGGPARSGVTGEPTEWAGAAPWLQRAAARKWLVLIPASLSLALITQLWLGQQHAVPAPAFFALYLAGVLLVWALHQTVATPRAPELAPRAAPGIWDAFPIVVAGLAGGMAVRSAGAVQSQALWEASTWWGIGMLLPACALAVAGLLNRKHERRFWPGLRWTDTLLVLGLFCLALAMRIPDLTGSPPFLHGDEAQVGLFGRAFNAGQVPLLSLNGWNGGLPELSYAWLGFGLRLFGDNLVGLRLTNALAGSLSVVFIYFLGRDLFGRRTAFFAGFCLAVMFLHVDLSRDGMHTIQGPICIALTLWLFVSFLRNGGVLCAYLAGLSVILDLQVYWAARVGPLLLVVPIAYVAISRRSLLSARMRELAWFGVGLWTAGVPVVALFRANPGSFAGRQSGVGMHLNLAAGTANFDFSPTQPILDLLRNQLWAVITTFSATPDVSWQIGWDGAMLDTVSAALLPAALLLSLVRWRHWGYGLAVCWFGLVIGADALTVNQPWWPRMAALLPAVALLLGALISELWDYRSALGRRWRPLFSCCLAALLVGMAFENAHRVYLDYPAAKSQQSIMADTLVAEFLAQTPGANHTIILSDGTPLDLTLDYPPLPFLNPHVAGCALPVHQSYSVCASMLHTARIFVFMPGRIGEVHRIARMRPGGRIMTVGSYGHGSVRIIAYELR